MVKIRRLSFRPLGSGGQAPGSAVHQRCISGQIRFISGLIRFISGSCRPYAQASDITQTGNIDESAKRRETLFTPLNHDTTVFT
jgi:hypothetical protein